MEHIDDYELFDKNFELFIQKGLEEFGFKKTEMEDKRDEDIDRQINPIETSGSSF